MGRTPLIYACCEMGGDAVVKAMLTVGRANLGAICPERVEIEAFFNGAGDYQHKNKHKNGAEAKRKSGAAFSSNLRFVPAPCNTSNFTALAVLKATLHLDDKASRDPLFPRDDRFHMKTGQVKAKKKRGKGGARASRMAQLSNKFSKGDVSDGGAAKEYRGGDPATWLCGRLLHAVSKKNKKKQMVGPKQRLTQLFRKYDELGYGSLEFDNFQVLLRECAITCDDEVVKAVCKQFRDMRNR